MRHACGVADAGETSLGGGAGLGAPRFRDESSGPSDVPHRLARGDLSRPGRYKRIRCYNHFDPTKTAPKPGPRTTPTAIARPRAPSEDLQKSVDEQGWTLKNRPGEVDRS